MEKEYNPAMQFDAFTGGIEEGGLRSSSSISLLACYIIAKSKERLTAKIKETLADNIDESVLATELVIYADKICVDEELVRLKSHIQHMREILETEETVGRKLDFMTQELNREANTTLSKANDIIIADLGIILKTEIEKFREQIQNLE